MSTEQWLTRHDALRERVKVLEQALEEICKLGETDGPAAPLLVRAGDIAQKALDG